MSEQAKIDSKNDRTWMWACFATAVGAGVLYLPINAGINGIWPIALIAIFTIPMIYLSHCALSRVLLIASKDASNINDVISDNFSSKFCNIFSLFYLMAMYPLILIYSVGLTNTVNSVLINIFKIDYIPRYVLAFVLLFGFLMILITQERLIRKVTQMLAIPLAGFLFILSIYLIPQWNFEYLKIIPTSFDFFETLILTLPVIIFSFNYSPIISTFTLHYIKKRPNAEHETREIIFKTTCLLFAFIMLFVFSCVLSVNPSHMELAKQSNVNILIYMSEYFSDPILRYVNPCVAIIAMTGAFFGTFFGAKESVIGIIEQFSGENKISSKNLNYIAIATLIIPSYILSIYDANILKVISIICGPVIAALLFIFPVYAVYKIPALKKYHIEIRDKLNNYFVLIVGLVGFSAILYSFKFLRMFLK